MRKLLNLINGNLLDQRTENIMEGKIEQGMLKEKVREINEMGEKDRVMYLTKLNSRVKQITKPEEALSVMQLIAMLMKSNHDLNLPHLEFTSLKQKQTKESIALCNILRYFNYFLMCNNANKFNAETISVENQLFEADHYCQMVVLKITEFMKIEYIFMSALKDLKQHSLLLRLIARLIMDRFREDMTILTTFVKNNYSLILQRTVKHPLVSHIHYLYERLIHINKNYDKLESINKLIQANLFFPTFEVNEELHTEIEKTMMAHQSERVELAQNQIQVQDCMEQPFQVCTTESFFLLGDVIEV